jgi:hypothetical protein
MAERIISSAITQAGVLEVINDSLEGGPQSARLNNNIHLENGERGTPRDPIPEEKLPTSAYLGVILMIVSFSSFLFGIISMIIFALGNFFGA